MSEKNESRRRHAGTLSCRLGLGRNSSGAGPKLPGVGGNILSGGPIRSYESPISSSTASIRPNKTQRGFAIRSTGSNICAYCVRRVLTGNYTDIKLSLTFQRTAINMALLKECALRDPPALL
jgi:hypothetical protein